MIIATVENFQQVDGTITGAGGGPVGPISADRNPLASNPGRNRRRVITESNAPAGPAGEFRMTGDM